MAESASARGFDRLAWAYRPLEYLLAGKVMQAARTAHLHRLDSPGNILIVGEGPGRLLEALVARFPTSKITVVEQSERMIAVATRRLGHGTSAQITFVLGDLFTTPLPPLQYDVIVTPFVLDCFTPPQVEAAVARMAALANADASWLHTDFQIPASGWRNWRARMVHRIMYLFFRYATRLPASKVHPPDASLRHHGFDLIRRETFNAGLIRADYWRRRG